MINDHSALDSKSQSSLRQNRSREVFYIPGIYGDQPKQESLRNCVVGIKFHVITLPELNVSSTVLSSLVETARLVANYIDETQKEGEVYIVGFSWGAGLAVEVAVQLKLAGRTVEYLGLIDCPLYIDENRRTLRRLMQVILAPKFFLKLRRFTRNVFHYNYKMIRRIPIVPTASEYRFLSLRLWSPQTCDAKGIMILSAEFRKMFGEKWKAICPNIKQVEIRSDHEDIILGKNLNRVATVLANDIAEKLIALD